MKQRFSLSDSASGIIKYSLGHPLSDGRKSKDGSLAYDRDGKPEGCVEMNEDSEKVTIRLPKRYLRALDFLVQLDDFPSRSEAIRESIRDMVYSRTELVMDRLEKMKKAEESLASMETFQKEYMKQ